jgi:hypothetical protein
MQERSLWLTYLSTEEAEEVLRTPRTENERVNDGSGQIKHEFLRRGTRS